MNVREYINLFKDFPDRETKLRAITRYSLYPVMFYRTNLWTHSKRVAWITETIAPSAQKVWPNFDLEKAIIMALCHDDQEIIMGDIQAGNKAKMSAEQLAEVAKIEAEAIDRIAAQFPEKIGNYTYKDLLTEIAEIKTPESIVVKYADKMDGFGEGLHEIFSSNPHFNTNVINEYGVIPTPREYYLHYFENFTKNFPTSSVWLQPTEGIFMNTTQLDSIYNSWKELTLSQNDAEEIANLSTQKEFLAKN